MNSIPRRHSARMLAVASLAAAIMLTGCASTPPAPTAQLAAAQQAISNAEQADAGRHAAAELSEARTRLVAANAAVQDERMLAAEQLAEQSLVAAQLAAARTAQLKAQAVNDEMQRSTGTLVEEMQRSTGESK